jgi:hypothetical protein
MKKTLSLLLMAAGLFTSAALRAQTCCDANAGIDKTICCPGNSTTIGATPAGTASGGGCDTILYRWTPTTGLSCSTCPNPSASPGSTTNYVLTVIYKKKNSNDTCCKNKDTVKVTVNTTCCRIGAGGLAGQPVNDKIKIYPVPSKQFVTIDPGYEMESGEITFFDISSRQVWRKEKIKGADKVTADLKDLPKGIYFVSISDNGQLIHSQKIVLQE